MKPKNFATILNCFSIALTLVTSSLRKWE